MRSLPKPASLSARITLLLVLTSLVVLGAGSKWMDWRIDHAMENRFEQNLLTQALTLRTAVQMEADASLHQQLLTPSHLLNGTDPTYYQVQCPGMPPLRSSPHRRPGSISAEHRSPCELGVGARPMGRA